MPNFEIHGLGLHSAGLVREIIEQTVRYLNLNDAITDIIGSCAESCESERPGPDGQMNAIATPYIRVWAEEKEFQQLEMFIDVLQDKLQWIDFELIEVKKFFPKKG